MSIVKLATYIPPHIKESEKGSLHRYLNIPEGENIPVSLLEEKLKTVTDPHIRKKLNFALVAKTKFHHKTAGLISSLGEAIANKLPGKLQTIAKHEIIPNTIHGVTSMAPKTVKPLATKIVPKRALAINGKPIV